MPASDKAILILGGTKEAASLASRLFDQGHDVTTSLAGRTREPVPLKGKTRIGGFGGIEGLVHYIHANKIYLLLDFTHPFATLMSSNARIAAAKTNVKFVAWRRPKWVQSAQDQWHHVASIPEAVDVIPSGAKVLLALGSQHIAPFAARADVHFVVRMVDPPRETLALPKHTLLIAKPGTLEEEFATLRAHAITHLVCRNSGGHASYTKIAAARLLAIPVILIEQLPEAAGTFSFADISEEILKLLGLD